jgi:hypothetical protein
MGGGLWAKACGPAALAVAEGGQQGDQGRAFVEVDPLGALGRDHLQRLGEGGGGAGGIVRTPSRAGDDGAED